MNTEKKNPPARRRILTAIAILLFVLAAAGWSYGWMRARDLTESRFNAWLANEAKAGRAHECNNRQSGGYPFRVEIRCDAPLFRLGNADDDSFLSLSSFRLIVPAYAPNHVIAELAGPATLTQHGKSLTNLSSGTIRIILRHDWHSVQDISLNGDDVAFDLPTPGGSAFAHRAELQMRPLVSQDAQMPDLGNFQIAFKAQQARIPGASPDQTMDIELSGTLYNWPSLREAAPAMFENWRQHDGKIEMKDFRIRRNGGQLFANGELRLNDTHRLDGRFTATFVNSPALLRGLLMQGQNDAGALFAPLLLMLGKPVEFENQRATSLQLKIENGVLTLGAAVLAEFPPLY